MKKNLNSTAIIIVNWNGWQDTVCCLNSLLPTLSRNDQVIICDNASMNGSMEYIKKWLSAYKTEINNTNLSKNQIGWIAESPVFLAVE